MEIIRDIDQGTDEWFNLRLGMVTSSCFEKVMSKGRGNAPSKTRESYMFDLAFERVTGKKAPDSFKSEWMERGNEIEAQARAMYELDTGVEVEEIAFIKLDDNIGASTDGLINDDKGVLEIKCPKHTTHMKYLMNPDELYKTYKKQVQGELLVSGREYCHLISFHPDFDDSLKMVSCFIERDEDFITEMKAALILFLDDLDDMVENLKKRK